MGRFEWLRRMGVHEAYHLSRANRLVHWLCIPIELFAVVKLLTLIPAAPIALGALGRLDAALVVIALVGLVYLAADLPAGALMTACLLGLRQLAPFVTSGSLAIDAAIAVAAFVVPFVVQTRVGHGIFEQGIDDTAMNLAELRRTRDPVPILLVFFYHLVEILFALGYRPALRLAMEGFRAAELARIDPDPRHAQVAAGAVGR
jgi:uncharacterized membrane protein YGL010W